MINFGGMILAIPTKILETVYTYSSHGIRIKDNKKVIKTLKRLYNFENEKAEELAGKGSQMVALQGGGTVCPSPCKINTSHIYLGHKTCTGPYNI